MNEVKWIKITTDMFEDEKIDFIESLPEADSILIIWIRLLAMAGKTNDRGYIMLTESIPYTDDMLAHKFKKSINIIRLSLQTFISLQMVEVTTQGYNIINWEKHQNIDGLEKIREQNRISAAKYREKKKLCSENHMTIEENHVTNILPSCSNHATDIELDKDKDKDKDIVPKKIKETKIEYAERVKMTEIEYNKLLQIYSKTIISEKIIDLDLWKGSKGKSTKSDYLTLLAWLRKDKPIIQNGSKIYKEFGPAY